MKNIQPTYGKLITDYYTIKKYGENYYKLTFHKMPVKRPGFDSDECITPSRDINLDKLENNLIRAKSKVFEYSMCNEFEHFITLTLSPAKYNRENLNQYIKELGQFIRNIRRNHNTDIQYILIPEQHKDGAWHMHGLIKGIPSEQLSNNSNGYKDWKAYSDKFGYMSIDNIRSQESVSKYITKYIAKTLEVGGGVTEKNKKLYYVSRGLEKSQKIREGTLSSSQLEKIPFEYENDYIRSLTINTIDNPFKLKIIENILDT